MGTIAARNTPHDIYPMGTLTTPHTLHEPHNMGGNPSGGSHAQLARAALPASASARRSRSAGAQPDGHSRSQAPPGPSGITGLIGGNGLR